MAVHHWNRRYIAATAGALIGAVVLGPITSFAAYRLELWRIGPDEGCAEMMCFHSLSAVIAAIFGFISGLWIGTSVGCWVGLRVRGFGYRGVTVGFIQLLVVLWAMLVLLATPVVVNAEQRWDLSSRIAIGIDSRLLVVAAITGVIMSVSTVARYLALLCAGEKRIAGIETAG